MVTISFPPSPNTGDIYTFGGRAWQWNGYAWQIYPSSFTSGLTINATTISGGTSGRVLYDNAGVVGELATVPIAQGGTNASSFTTNYVTYYNGTSLTGNSGLQYDGTTLTTSADATIHTLTVGLGGGAVASNTAVGLSALAANTSGSNNVSIGYQSLLVNTSGTNNTAVGASALAANINGGSNVALGVIAGNQITSGSFNVAVGTSSYPGGSGSNNTFVGTGSNGGATGTSFSDSVGVGSSVLFVNTGAQNTAVGSNSLRFNTSGTPNTAVGYRSLYNNITGANNVAVGDSALLNTTGNGNTAIGSSSGYQITSGNYNTVIGAYSGSAAPISATGSNYVVLSDGQGNVRQVIDGSGNALFGTTTSGVAKVVVKNTPTSQWGLDFTQSTVTVPNGSNVDLAAGGGMVMLTDITSTGYTGVYICGGASVALVSQSGGATYVTPTTTPAAGKFCVAFNSGNGVYSIYNNYGNSITFNVALIATKASA